MVTVPGGEAVEAVGEVDRVGGPRDDQEDEHVVAGPEVDVGVDERDEDVGREVLAMRHHPHAGDDRREQEQLPAPAQAQRAAPRQLQVVVGKADRRAGERRAGDGQARRRCAR